MRSHNFFVILLSVFVCMAVVVIVVVAPNKSKRTVKNSKIEVINGYTKDSQNVYLNGKKIVDITADKFSILAPNFGKDNKWAYFGNGGMGSFKINNADAKTFEVLGGGYAKDRSRVFCCQIDCEVMRGVAGNLEVIGDGGYAKDNLNAYRGCEKLIGVDQGTFRVIGVNYYLDKKAVYFVDQVVHEADSGTFKVVNDIYGVDKNGIYYGSMRILDADPATFKPLGDYYSKDKTFVYFQGKVLGSGVNTATFETLANNFARDKNFVYYFGKKMAEIDRNSFKVLDIEYGVDVKGVYFDGIKMDKADPVTFKVLTNFFAKDGNNVYRYGQLTKYDTASFVVLDDGKYKDKNGMYSDQVNVTQ